ncbi:MAG: DUF2202 domain-containing protein [Kiritimatiellia bacterium]
MNVWISFFVIAMTFSLQAGGPGRGVLKNGRGCGSGRGGNVSRCTAVPDPQNADKIELKMPKEAWIRLWADELAARDLYAELDQQTQRPVFQNIGLAEVHHRELIVGLLKMGGVDIPEELKAGTYGDPEIDKVYAELLALGRQGELDAFRAGAAFEELDITELEREMAREDLSDPERQLLTALRDASVRHLQAFRRQIVRLGGTPERTHLSEERLKALLGL